MSTTSICHKMTSSTLLTQFCGRLKTVILQSIRNTSLRDSLDFKDCYVNINSLPYLLTLTDSRKTKERADRWTNDKAVRALVANEW